MADTSIAQDPSTGINSETDISIEALTIITGTGNKISVKEIMVEMNVYEDIFSHTISADMILEDTLGMIEALPICGQEWLFVRISKPGFEDTEDKTQNEKYNLLLRIYKITTVKPSSERKQHYVVHATSERLINAQRLIVGKTYKNVKPERAISDILKNELEATEDNGWVKKIEESATSYSFVIPNLKPFDAIKLITSHAVNKINGMKDFMFYENGDGYYLRSLTSLLNVETAKTEKRYYSINPMNKNMIGADQTKNDINPYEYVFSPLNAETEVLYDQIGSYNRGEFGTNQRHLNIATANNDVYERTYFHFMKKYDKSLLNKYPKIPVNDWGEGTYSEGLRGFTFDTLPFLNDVNTVNSFATNGHLKSERIMKLATISDQKIKLHLPGNPFMKLGAVVFYNVPSVKPRNDDGDNTLDKFVAGNYLVTSIRHKFSRDRWDTIIELSKDSLNEKLTDHAASNFEVTQ